jgi:hypothetical protein
VLGALGWGRERGAWGGGGVGWGGWHRDISVGMGGGEDGGAVGMGERDMA